ncbi:MAG: cell division protein SepF [Clostridia bacterium]|nr:cell division protein SepF [Clostridia bacterium]
MQDLRLNQGTKEIKVFTPYSLAEAEEIIEYLKLNPLILNVKGLKPNLVQRFLDLMSGAVSALDKNVCVLDKDNYLFLGK